MRFPAGLEGEVFPDRLALHPVDPAARLHAWNIIVGDGAAWLIDWEEPRVCDPALELALLAYVANLPAHIERLDRICR